MKPLVLALALTPAARTPTVLPAAPSLSASLLPAPLAAPLAAPALAPSLAAPAAPAAPLAIDALRQAALLPAPAKDARPEALGRDAFWDGLAARPEAGASDPLLSFLDAGRLAPRVDAALRLARTTDAGRRALAAAEKALAGAAPVPVRGAKLKSDHGHYDYVRREIVLSRSTLADPRALAITLAHELRHVAQHAEGVIAEALEMELEAHLDSLEMARELGLPLDGFQKAFAEHAALGRDALYAWMRGQLPGKTVLRGADYEELADELESELETVSARRRPAVERDLALISTNSGRAANRALAARVARRLSARAP